MVGDSAETSEELTQKWGELVLDIESRAHGHFSTANGFRFSLLRSPIINNPDIEEGSAFRPTTFSLTNLLTPTTKFNKTESLPTTHSNPESMHGRYVLTPTKTDRAALSIPRSRSVPILINKDASVKSFGTLRVTPTPSHQMILPSKLNDENDYSGEDVAEEEAVCRICMVELGEDSEVFKMECMCKGELALAHKECTIKWFSIKGNITCDVCKQDVKNLSVTLLRVEETRARPRVAWENLDSRVNEWQDVPILVIVSMLAYFCFLEQLLVMDMKASAVAIALPFSCIIGLFSTMTSVTMVKKNYVWIYATIQFCLVLLFAHLLYSVIRFDVGQPVVCILLATLIGFGLTTIGTTAIKVYLKCIRSAEPANIQVTPPE